MTVYERQRLFDGAANGRWAVGGGRPVGGCLSTTGYSLLTTGFNAAFVRVPFLWPQLDPVTRENLAGPCPDLCVCIHIRVLVCLVNGVYGSEYGLWEMRSV